MTKQLIDGAGVPQAGKSKILTALNSVAEKHKIDPAAIAGIIDMESKWDTQCVTNSYIGLTQVGPDFIASLGMQKSDFLALTAAEQIEAYGKWLDYYKFDKKVADHGMNVSAQPVERQAAVLQAMQFAPNAKKWKDAFARGDYSVRSTSAKQADALGDTSIADMESYYKSFFSKRPPSYAAGGAPMIGAAPVVLAALQVGKTMVVSGEGVYVRSSPQAGSDRNVLGELDYGAKVVLAGPAAADGYLPVVVAIDGVSQSGFLHGRYLRPEDAPKIESAIQAAVVEWVRFEKGDGVETVEPYSSYIAEYWRLLGQNNLSGKDTNWYWSAAFICFILNKAGYTRTRFDKHHSVYIHQSIQNRITNTQGDFWGYRIDEAKPQVGDLVCQWRETETTYEIAEMRSLFPSHTDIIIAVRDRAVITLGGNVANAASRGQGVSVETKTFDLDANGFLMSERRVFAIMKNQNR